MIARRLPETLAEFKHTAISLEHFGDRSLQEFEDPEAILDDLEASTAWRPGSLPRSGIPWRESRS